MGSDAEPDDDLEEEGGDDDEEAALSHDSLSQSVQHGAAAVGRQGRPLLGHGDEPGAIVSHMYLACMVLLLQSSCVWTLSTGMTSAVAS